jgi:phage FluMu gp28-like protein
VKNVTIQMPPLYPKQAAFVNSTARYTIVEATVKAGKTCACLAWILKLATEPDADGKIFWWVAPIVPQAKIAYRRLKSWLAEEAGVARFNETEMSISLANGASIVFKSADHPDSLFGESVFGAVIDEATRCKEESWHALRTTLTSTRGPIKIIGNVRGRQNWAYRMARRAQSGEPNMAYFKLTAQDAIDAGILAADEITDAEASLPPAVFRELYFAEPSDDGGNPFGLDAIESCIAPLYGTKPAVWGVDLAKSIDWTVAVGLDEGGHVCRIARWQSNWEATMDRLESIVGEIPALVDSTGVGDPVVEQLQRRMSQVEGFNFTSSSKQQLMEGLSTAIQKHEITFPDSEIAQELREFGYEYTRTGVRYSAPEGLHDDCVCALALATQIWRRTAYAPPVAIINLADALKDDLSDNGEAVPIFDREEIWT